MQQAHAPTHPVGGLDRATILQRFTFNIYRAQHCARLCLNWRREDLIKGLLKSGFIMQVTMQRLDCIA